MSTTSINPEYDRAAFDLTITHGTCYSQFKLFQIVLYQAVVIFVADIIMLLAPMLILCGLQMPKRQIAALMAIFGTGQYKTAQNASILMSNPGTIACIAPVVRFSTLDYLRKGTTDLTCTKTYSNTCLQVANNQP